MNSASIAMLLVVLAAPAFPAQLATALDLNDRGNRASEAGRAEEAIGLYREATTIWRQAGPRYDAHLAGTLYNLGIAVSATGNRTEAVRLLGEALALHRKTLGMSNLRTISNVTLLASNDLMIGHVDEADALLQEALPVTRQLFPKDIQMARVLEGICNVLVRRGRAAEALAPAEEALPIAIEAAGEESLDAALAYSSVAEIHRTLGHPERALPLFRKARMMYEKVLGPDHPRVAALLSQEGLILMDDGKSATAEQLMTDAVEKLERKCSTCNVELAIAENNLAILRFRQTRYKEAGALLTRVMELREHYSTTPGPEMADTLRMLAMVRKKEKRYADAERLTHRADVIMGYR